MHTAPAYLAASLMAAPVLAQDMDVIERCSSAAIGSEICDGDELAENLGLLAAGDVRIFHDFGMESFAMLTALRYAASAIYFEAEGEGCYAEEERTAAVEIWSIWVKPEEDLPQPVREKYEMFDGVMDNIVQMKVGC